MHQLFDFWFFDAPMGSTKYIHDLIDHGDIGYVATFGVKHRQFMHDERAVQFIENNYGPYAAMVARGHIALDKVYSQMRRNKQV